MKGESCSAGAKAITEESTNLNLFPDQSIADRTPFSKIKQKA